VGLFLLIYKKRNQTSMKLERFNTLNEGKIKELMYDVVDQVIPKIDPKKFHAAKDKVAFLNTEIDNAMKEMEQKTAEFADKFRDGVIGAIMAKMEETVESTSEAQRYYDGGKEKPAKETVQKYYGDGVKHDDGNAVTKKAGTGKIKRFADMSKEQKNKADDKKKVKPGVQKVKPKDYIVKGYKVAESEINEKIDDKKVTEFLNKKFADWKTGHDNSQDADEVYVALIDEFNPSTNPRSKEYEQLMKLAYSWVGLKLLDVKYKRWDCYLQFGEYNNGRTAIELIDKKNGEPVLVATVNIPQEKLDKDEIIIKNWSENEGILDVLQKAGIVGEIIRKVPTGHVEADVVKLLKTK